MGVGRAKIPGILDEVDILRGLRKSIRTKLHPSRPRRELVGFSGKTILNFLFNPIILFLTFHSLVMPFDLSGLA